jgi:hypothetical protein
MREAIALWASAIAVGKAHAEHGAQNVRVIKADVDFNAIEKAFQIPSAGTLGNYRYEKDN